MIVGTHYCLISFENFMKLFNWKENMYYLNHKRFYIHGGSMDISYTYHHRISSYILSQTLRHLQKDQLNLRTHYGISSAIQDWMLDTMVSQFLLWNDDFGFRRSTSIQKLCEHSIHITKYFKNLYFSCLEASYIGLIFNSWRFNANIENVENEGFIGGLRLIDVNLWTE